MFQMKLHPSSVQVIEASSGSGWPWISFSACSGSMETWYLNVWKLHCKLTWMKVVCIHLNFFCWWRWRIPRATWLYTLSVTTAVCTCISWGWVALYNFCILHLPSSFPHVPHNHFSYGIGSKSTLQEGVFCWCFSFS